MARIPLLDPADSMGSNRALFQRMLDERHLIPDLMRTVGRRPEALRTLVEHLGAVMNEGTVPRLLKELLVIRVAQGLSCEALVLAHGAVARRLGAKAEQLEAMRTLDHGPGRAAAGFPADCIGTAPVEPPPTGPTEAPDAEHFTTGEMAALVFAGRVSTGTGAVSDETFAGLREQFDDGEIVEIALVVSLADALARFSNALGLETTI